MSSPIIVAQPLALAGMGFSAQCPWWGRAWLKYSWYSFITRCRCRSLKIRKWSRHSRRTLPRNRSQIAFAFGAPYGVRSTSIPVPEATLANKPAILPVIVPNQIPRSFSKRRRFPQLLGHPGIRRVPRHTEVHQSSRAQLDDDEHEQRSEEQVIRLEEIAGPYLTGMVSQKGGPRLFGRPRFPHFIDVLLNRCSC